MKDIPGVHDAHSQAPSKETCAHMGCTTLRELWFHTGTNCNLQCHGCFEGAGPGRHRIEAATFNDMRPSLDEAVRLGVENISFTGGEPFLNPDLLRTLDYALDHTPCLVLSNGTAPLQNAIKSLAAFLRKPHPLSFRISLDYPDAARHDAVRGEGRFEEALAGIQSLYRSGFAVSVACRRQTGEQQEQAEAAYQRVFAAQGLPADLPLVSFPELKDVAVLQISEHCLAHYHTAESRAGFMCAFSRMVVKQNGKMGVYACTLVDDDPVFNLGATLEQAVATRVMLRHPRCSVCFSHKVSCSQL